LSVCILISVSERHEPIEEVLSPQEDNGYQYNQKNQKAHKPSTASE
jgi:hypothetical protein